MSKTAAFFLLISTAIASNPIMAATWYVRQDGAGDFEVIQDAIDSALPGDTIDIGPGWYSEYRTFYGYYVGDIYVDVDTDDLTLHGAGPGLTIIGPPTPQFNDHQTCGLGVTASGRFSISGCEFRYLDSYYGYGIYIIAETATISNCLVADSRNGIFLRGAGTGSIIEDCSLRDITQRGMELRGTSSATAFTRCVSDDVYTGMYLAEGTDIVVQSCTFTGGRNGAGLYGSATGIIRDCEFLNQTIWSLAVNDNSSVNLAENVVDDVSGIGLSLLGGAVTGTGNIIRCGGYACVGVREMTVESFHDNQFLASGSAYAVKTFGSAAADTHLDFTHNWWGTDDPAAIAAGIWDGDDQANSHLFIDYMPFLAGPVATERASWGDVKSLYR